MSTTFATIAHPDSVVACDLGRNVCFRERRQYVPAETECGEFRLKGSLLVDVRSSPEECVATVWSSRLHVAGGGDSEDEAIKDLLSLLGDYRSSLQDYEAGLASEEAQDLALLRDLLV